MFSDIITFIILSATVEAGSKANGAAQFWFGDIARWMLPRIPDQFQ